MRKRKEDVAEEKYLKLLRVFHWVMYPIVAFVFLGLGMTIIRHYPGFIFIESVVENGAYIGGGLATLLGPYLKAKLLKKAEKK